MNNKGQSILSEYVMIFFVVIAAATAMTTYLQRAFEARVHDARNYAINSVISSGACDANCVNAAGGNLTYEYEPYYTVTSSLVGQNAQDNTTLTQGNAEQTASIYVKSINENTGSTTFGCQLPPACTGLSGTLPCYCTCPTTC